MKAQDWSAVIVLCLCGLASLFFAIDGLSSGEIICLARGCSSHILLNMNPKTFYFNLGELLVIASVGIGGCIQIIRKSKKNERS